MSQQRRKHFMTKMLKNDVTLAVEAIEKSSLVANTTMDAVTANAFMLKHGITIYRWREFITSFNNLKEKQKEEGKFLPRVFVPLDQVLKARAEATTHISRDSYTIGKKHFTKSLGKLDLGIFVSKPPSHCHNTPVPLYP